MKRPDRERGFTLLEMMMAFIGVLAVAAIVATTLSSSSQFVGASVKRGSSQTALRSALDALSSELQWANGTTMIISQFNGSSRVDFKVPVAVVSGAATLSTTITYRVDPSTLDANGNGVPDDGMLVRVQDGVTRVVCQRLSNGGLLVTRAGDQLTLHVEVMMPDDKGGVMKYAGDTTVQIKNGG
jgi:type II secretory pathway pseudopilin PulG